ncbi:MAG: trypsin-like peptidase domain-containing protein [Deltaproteobacteria bacterium]|nr:trypsin-like peptidase domain-containing protein [Deltaproteobacteria bacterium]
MFLLIFAFLLPSQNTIKPRKNNKLVTFGKFTDINPGRITPVVKAVHKILPSVVSIYTVKNAKNQSGNKFGLGSGLIYTSDGYIITNDHVVAGSKKIKVKLHDKRIFDAKVIVTDQKLDISLLKISGKNLPVPLLGDSYNLLQGETVLSIGNPYGLTSTVTKGIISAVTRNFKLKNRIYGNVIQTDAPISPGNSGGPLVNILGEVIGITAAGKTDGGNIGFAIPIDIVKVIVKELLKYGKIRNIFMGVTIRETKKGILITDVTKNSPAFKAGLSAGQYIKSIRGVTILDSDDFSFILSTFIVGDRVNITTNSGKFTVTVGELTPLNAVRIFAENLGVSLKKNNGKIFIMNVRKNSIASSKNILNEDILIAVNSKKFKTFKELGKFLLSVRQGTVIRLLIKSKHGSFIVPYTI